MDTLLKWKIVAIALAIVVLGLGTLMTIMYLGGSGSGSSTAPAAPLFSREELSALADTDKAFVAVNQVVSPAVVQVETVIKYSDTSYHEFGGDMFEEFFGESPFDDFFGGSPFEHPGGDISEYYTEAMGSGVIVSDEGYILTNNHVVADAEEITVHLSDGRSLPAVVIGADAGTDLAVIHVEATELPVATLGNSDSLLVGDWVVAIGSPFGLASTVTAGIVSALGRDNMHLADYEEFIQTDAAINPGNSGGALSNLAGEVVGINTAIATQTGSYMGVGFAIPINLARNIMEQLIETGTVTRGWLGVTLQDVTPELAEALELPDGAAGVLIGEVLPDTPADDAGFKAGDLITTLDGEAMDSSNELRNKVAAARPGESLTLTILRHDKLHNLSFTVGERPAELTRGGGSPSHNHAPQQATARGITVEMLTGDLAAQLGYDGTDGVVVTNVEGNSAAAQAGLYVGMIILSVGDEDVRSPAEFAELVKDTDEALLLYAWNSGGRIFLALPPE